ncbi:MAG: hypothetical protein PHF31_17510, partial [Methylobacter sp.]|nr:hypothetical protein [Methylobacter sp.]
MLADIVGKLNSMANKDNNLTFNSSTDSLEAIADVLSSIYGVSVLGFGTFTTSSTTVPADNTRAALYPSENNNYWNGCFLMPLTGNAAMQPRYIANYASATGVFTLAASNPFTSAPGLVNYVIISGSNCQVCPVDSFTNLTINDVIGNKADSDAFDPASAHSLVRLLKAVLRSVAQGYGTFTTSSATVPADTSRTEANGFFNGAKLLIRSGSLSGQQRRIVKFTQPGGIFTLDDCCPFTS